jgi:microcystin-dependent protein
VALDFPNSPTLNQVFKDSHGVAWIWDGVKWSNGEIGSGFLPLAGGTLTGNLKIIPPSGDATVTVYSSAGNSNITMQKAGSGFISQILGYTGTIMRWLLALGDTAAESTGNLGSNFSINRYSDTSELLDTPLTISRATGNVSVLHAPANPNDVATKGYVDTSSIMLGEIKMYAGVTPPTNWTWCFGQAVSRTTYAGLFAVLSTRFGAGDGSTTFNLPTLNGRVPVGYDGGGWSMGLLGGEQNHTLSGGEMPSHGHGVSDPTHAHSLYDPGHNHGHSDPGHNHGFNDPGHAHSYTMWQASGGLPVNGATTYTQGSVGSTTGGSGTGCWLSAAGTGMSNVAAGTGMGVYGSGTGISIVAAGGSAAHNNMQPYQCVGFIIRIQ